ncbi:YybH family protein [Woodsholea maritima]|uniref:YybH family protein n=1 Tax=Woodsholea maritima TaxID=240237 RepID=UPI00037CC875|nr:DUF4440 domain-containing protein [Woodsholea maritima]
MSILLSVLVLALSTPPNDAAQDEASETRAIASVIEAQRSAWNDGDVEGYMQGYWQDEALRFASGGTITYGWQQTLDRYKARYNTREAMGHLDFTDVEITLMDDDDGLVFGRWALTREGDHPSGLFTLHVHKFDEGWRVVADHTSSAD